MSTPEALTESLNYTSTLQNSASTVDLSNPALYEDKSHEIFVLHSVLPAVTLVFLLLRNYSRFFFMRAPGWDDFLLNVGWIFTLVMEVMVCLQAKHGLGKHIIVVSIADRAQFLKLNFIGQIIYCTANFFIKSALLFFYLRIAVLPIYQRICYLLMSLNLALLAASYLGIAFLCKPIGFFWNRSLNGGHGSCGDLEVFFIAFAATNMLMDVFTLILPIPIVWGSPSLSRSNKIKISCLFLLGGVTVICSILRINAFRFVGNRVGGDATWTAPNAHKWNSIELDCAIIAACIPAIKPLLRALLGKATPMDPSNNKSKVSPIPEKGNKDTWPMSGNLHHGRTGHGGVVTSVTTMGAMVSHKRGASKAHGRGDHIMLEEMVTIDVDANGDSPDHRWPHSASTDSIISSEQRSDSRAGKESRRNDDGNMSSMA